MSFPSYELTFASTQQEGDKVNLLVCNKSRFVLILCNCQNHCGMEPLSTTLCNIVDFTIDSCRVIIYVCNNPLSHLGKVFSRNESINSLRFISLMFARTPELISPEVEYLCNSFSTLRKSGKCLRTSFAITSLS